MPFMERGTLLNPPKMDTFREQLYHVTTSVEDYRATGVPTLLIASDEDILSWPELSEMVHSKHPKGGRNDNNVGRRGLCV